jgi:ParB-like chromosome segregation protein Spo0J
VNTSQTCERKSVSTEEPAEDMPWSGCPGRVVTCHLTELHQHPSYVRHHLAIPASDLSAPVKRGDLAFLEPLMITQDGTILAGYERVEVARQHGLLSIPCLEYEFSEAEALQWLLQKHRPLTGMNAFSRILLALDLEAWLREKARSNQQAGGRNKGSSKLTEAEKVDVTAKIAEVADVSVGSISKVRQLLRTAVPELLQALRRDEISIHRAWLLSNEPPANQREELAFAQCKRNIKKDMRTLASRHGSKSLPIVSDPSNLLKRLSALEPSKRGSFRVFVSNAQGRAVGLTKELLLELDAQQELIPTC